MIGSGTILPGSIYLFSQIVKPPYQYERITPYLVCEVNIENVKLPIFLNDIAFFIYNEVCVVSLVPLSIDLLMKPAQREPYLIF